MYVNKKLADLTEADQEWKLFKRVSNAKKGGRTLEARDAIPRLVKLGFTTMDEMQTKPRPKNPTVKHDGLSKREFEAIQAAGWAWWDDAVADEDEED